MLRGRARRGSWAALILLAAAGSLAETAVDVGTEAPDFTLKDQAGEEVSLISFREDGAVLLAFYPEDGSPGCRNQMKCFVSERRRFEDLGVTVVAISKDSPESHAGFAKALGIKFPLLADEDMAVAKRYGVHVQSTTGGFACRSVFLVDREGNVRFVDRDYRVPRERLGTDLLAAMEALGGETPDPLTSLADAPEHERIGKTLLYRYMEAVCAEDIKAVDDFVHPDYGTRPGETGAMQQERRKAEVQRHRDLFARVDLGKFEVKGLGDALAAKVYTKEKATTMALARLSMAGKALGEALEEGELLVVCITNSPKTDGYQILPRELVLRLRKHERKDEAVWKIYARSDR